MATQRSTLTILGWTALLVLSGCARTQARDYRMTWETRPDSSRVVLIWNEFPNHYVDLEAETLRRYLDDGAPRSILARFEVTTRLGCLERIELTRIDGRRDWTKTWGGSGWVDQERPSPWDEFGCRIPWW